MPMKPSYFLEASFLKHLIYSGPVYIKKDIASYYFIKKNKLLTKYGDDPDILTIVKKYK
mgnify:CR=1 FL=1